MHLLNLLPHCPDCRRHHPPTNTAACSDAAQQQLLTSGNQCDARFQARLVVQPGAARDRRVARNCVAHVFVMTELPENFLLHQVRLLAPRPGRHAVVTLSLPLKERKAEGGNAMAIWGCMAMLQLPAGDARRSIRPMYDPASGKFHVRCQRNSAADSDYCFPCVSIIAQDLSVIPWSAGVVSMQQWGY